MKMRPMKTKKRNVAIPTPELTADSNKRWTRGPQGFSVS